MKKLSLKVLFSIIVCGCICYSASGDTLWRDDFTKFKKSDSYDSGWVFDSGLKAEPKSDGGILCVDISGQGYNTMKKGFKYDPSYRYFQIKLADIGPEPGFRFTDIRFGGAGGNYKKVINTSWPGTYTIDTYYISPNYQSGKDKMCYVTICVAGSKKDSGTITPGPKFTFDWIQLVDQPVNGLAVTKGDGSPLGDSIKKGDALLFQVYLEQPAADVSVEVFTNWAYTPLLINGESYVQLKKADGEAGKVWKAEVTIGSGTGKFVPDEYPVVFKAIIAGSEIEETYSSAFVSFE